MSEARPLTEEQQLRVKRIQTLCNEFIDKLAEHGISTWEIISEHGALGYINQQVQARPLTPLNELGQPKLYKATDNINELTTQPATESKETPDVASV